MERKQFFLPSRLVDMLRREAKATESSMAHVLRLAIEKYFERKK